MYENKMTHFIPNSWFIEKMKDKEFYIATRNGEFVIYTSERFKLTEIELLNLIKINFVQGRSKAIGRKFLRVYRDCTRNRKEVTEKKLKMIGVRNDKEPIKKKKPKTKWANVKQ